MKITKMSSIEQFSSAIKNLKFSYQYIGKDEDGKAMYDYSIIPPVTKFIGSEKLHGSSAGVNYNLETQEMKPQKKTAFITPEKDNYGFAFWFETNKDTISKIVKNLVQFPDEYKPKIEYNTVTVYGEWAGKGIQKSVGISELPKAFYIYAVKVSNDETSEWISPYYLIDTKIQYNNIYNVWNFKVWDIDIDLDVPSKSINTLEQFVKDIEEHSIIAETISDNPLKCTIGEGIVFWGLDKQSNWVNFKIKGLKHSKSRVKTIKRVDSALENLKMEIAEKVTPGWRLNQAIQEVFGENWENEITRKRIGEVLKYVFKDIIKEELDTISDAGLEPKQINGYVSKRVKEHFFIVEKECL